MWERVSVGIRWNLFGWGGLDDKNERTKTWFKSKFHILVCGNYSCEYLWQKSVNVYTYTFLLHFFLYYRLICWGSACYSAAYLWQTPHWTIRYNRIRSIDNNNNNNRQMIMTIMRSLVTYVWTYRIIWFVISLLLIVLAKLVRQFNLKLIN